MTNQLSKTIEESKIWGGGPHDSEDGPVILLNNSELEI